AYLEKIPLLNFQADREALGFAEELAIQPKLDASNRPTSRDYRLTTDEERQERLDALTRKDLTEKHKRRIPQYMHDLTQPVREAIHRDVLAFVNTFKGENPGSVAKIMLHLQFQAMTPIRSLRANDPRSELQRTLIFLTQEEDPSHPSP